MNKKKLIKWGIIIGVLVIIALVFIGQYNSLVNAEANIQEAQANIQVNLQKRADNIGQIVDSLQGYMDYESETYKEITEARTAMDNAVNNATDAPSTQNAIERTDEAAILVKAVAENYPELKADTMFVSLIDTINSIENEISYGRIQYNEKAVKYNKKLRKFPSNLFASLYGFEEVELFSATDSAQSVPNISFN